MIAEASQVVPEGQGMPATPGIHTDAQVAGWRLVTDGVHARGGRIFLQLWHVGRISHSSHQPGGQAPVAPSAIAAQGNALGADFKPAPFEVPRALSLDILRSSSKPMWMLAVVPLQPVLMAWKFIVPTATC